MNPNVAGSVLPSWGKKEHKLERIIQLEAQVKTLEDRVSLLFQASERDAQALNNTGEVLNLKIMNTNKQTLAEIRGVAQDLAKIRAWKERFLAAHPEFQDTMEPPSTTRRARTSPRRRRNGN